MKKLIILISLLLTCSFAACNFVMPTGNNSESTSVSSRKSSSKKKNSSSKKENSSSDDSDDSSIEDEKVILYQEDDIVREDLMWDTETLFEAEFETKDEDKVYLDENIQTFKFKGAPYNGMDETWVFSAVGFPTGPKPKDGYPAILLLGGGGYIVNTNWINYWTQQGYVVFTFDVWGWELDENGKHVRNPEGGPENNDGSNYADVNKPEESWVYHVIYNSIMANNFLRSQKNVDKDRIVVTGNSWGGYATCVLSGVDKRFAAFAPLNGCGYLYTDSKWAKGTFGGTEQKKWIDLYDPSSYLPYATKPMFFVSGVDDEYFSAYNRTRSAALVKGKTFFSQRYSLKHANWTRTEETYAFFDHVLYQGEFSQLSSPKTGYSDEREDYITFEYEDKAFEKVYFVYTESTAEDSHTWEWKRIEAEEVDGEYFVQMDPTSLRAYFFETEGEFSQSTPISITMNPNLQYH